jgi:hypothetical protein
MSLIIKFYVQDDVKKPIDLQKIFTPATDTDEILPGKNRKIENDNISKFETNFLIFFLNVY